jgi:hypothetical protein
LTEFTARQKRIFEIQAKIGEIRARTLCDRESGLARENRNDIGGKRAHFKIGGAFAELQRSNDGVGDDSETHAGELRSTAIVFRIAFDDNLFVLRLLNEAEGARADGMAREIGGGICRDDTDGGINEVDRKRGVWLAQTEDDRSVVGGVDGSDKPESPALWRLIGGIQNEINGGFDVGRGKWVAVVEADATAEMKDVSERIGSRPGFGEIPAEMHLIVTLEEAAEEEAVDALGLGIGGVARVEVGGIGFD